LKSKDYNKGKKINTFENQGSLEASNTWSRNTFLREGKLKFGGKQGSSENFLRRELSIYRGMG
jgi:hypothetical protein